MMAEVHLPTETWSLNIKSGKECAHFWAAPRVTRNLTNSILVSVLSQQRETLVQFLYTGHLVTNEIQNITGELLPKVPT